VAATTRYTMFLVWAACLSLAGVAAAESWPATPQDLDAFFDSIFADSIKSAHAPGAVVAVVHGGEVLFSKGYGTAKLGEDIPVDPDTTLFRVASISKLFAATAVMQLVERGKLNLHTDVNFYLKDFQLPYTYPDPVTLDNLMTHTGGFDDRFLGGAAPTHETMIPLGAYLAQRMPPRVMPPGVVMSYSNHGMALAGHIVEAVTGMPFAQYVDGNIFTPLGMEHSYFDLVPDTNTPLATGYNYYLGKYHEAKYDYPLTPPASTLACTAHDMSRFMIAHLQNGRYGNTYILDEDTMRLMHIRHFAHHPDMVDGRAYAFSEHLRNGHRTLEHTGLIWGFASLLLLIPDANTGLFVSSTTNGRGVYGAVSGRFVNRYFPAPPKRDADLRPAPSQPLEGSAQRIKEVAGYYRHNRYCRTTFFKFGVLIPRFVSEIHVKPGPEEGTIVFGKGAPLIEAEPYCFYSVNGKADARRLSKSPRAVFGRDEKEAFKYLATGSSAYDPIRWYESRQALTVAAAVSLFILLAGLVAWPLAVWIRRHRGRPSPQGNPAAAAWIGRAVCGLHVGFAAGLGIFVLTVDINSFGYGAPPVLVALLVLPLLAAGLTLALITLCVAAWAQSYWNLPARLFYTAITVANVAFLLVLNYVNMLGFNFG